MHPLTILIMFLNTGQHVAVPIHTFKTLAECRLEGAITLEAVAEGIPSSRDRDIRFICTKELEQ